MDWIGISAACVAARIASSKTARALLELVREVRESRADLGSVSADLHSLDDILDLIQDDAGIFPAELARTTPTMLEHCTTILVELEGFFSIINRRELAKREKRFRWLASRTHLAKLRFTLDVYKSTLGLALNLVTLTDAAQDQSSKMNRADEADRGTDASKHVEWGHVRREMGYLKTRLEAEFQQNGMAAWLQTYLEAMQAYAERATNLDHDSSASHSRHLSTASAPDSGIDMDDKPLSPDATAPSLPDEDECGDERTNMSIRPPTPPPRSPARMKPTALIDKMSMISPVRQATAPVGICERHTPRRSRSLESASSPCPRSLPSDETTSCPVQPTQSDKPSLSPSETESGALSQLIGQVRQAWFHTTPPAMPSNSTVASAVSVPWPPQSSSTSRWRRRRIPRATADDDASHLTPKPVTDAIAASGAVFGVPLKKSIKTAKLNVVARHGASGKSGSSSRDFPLCVLKCVSFLRSAGAVETPHVFAEGLADPVRVQHMKTVFSTAPLYGRDVDLAELDIGIHEAAELVLRFLGELPDPLIPESVALKWIGLARRSSLQHVLRQDQCVDFWTEAFGGVKSSHAKSLVKLLLDLWGDIADVASTNSMPAERLARRVLKPMTHYTPGKGDSTGHMLAMAFIIRKRSEYAAVLRGTKNMSNMAV